MIEHLNKFVDGMAFSSFTFGNFAMIVVSLILIYLAIKKKFEPLLLLPIGLGSFLANIPGNGLLTLPKGKYGTNTFEIGGLYHYLSYGINLELFPPLIFLGIGAMTDFGPLLSNPKTFLLGAAAQFGVFIALFAAVALGFTLQEAAAIGIIGGADGPTSIFLTLKLAPHLLGPIAVSAYSYMALVPLIQPPIMRLLTTQKERMVVMESLKPVSKKVKIIFPIVVMIVGILIVPPAAPLIGMLMGGNLLRESNVVERLTNMAQNELINIVTFFLGTCVGMTMNAEQFLNFQTLKILLLGTVAFGFSTAGGVIAGKIMYQLSGGKINPLIGAAGVSAVPMAARVAHNVGQEANPRNYLLMHAMGPNVAGVVGTSIAAGLLLSILGEDLTFLIGFKDKKKIKIKKNLSNLSKELVFPIVGIGTSAGGLEALEQFFNNIPEDNGMAFVVIQHLDPNYVGMLPELLQRTTSMKVVQATDHLCIEANHVYVIPPNKSMSILNSTLYLFEPLESRGLRLPINYFFHSLADDQKEKSIGIILSGMGSDGSMGLKAIKETNGVVLVQDPITAKFDGMPQSAINAVMVDIIAPANELPTKLINFLKYIPVAIPENESEIKNQSNLQQIIFLLRTQTDHDFSLYKKNTLFRRIERRMSVHQIEKMHNYVRFLQENSKELDILFKELLIGVTNFFRDAVVWQKLKDSILPDLFEELPNGHILRAWIPACSTGEEAYSLAIVFQEALEKVQPNKSFTLQIFATDIDNDAIEIARKGIFSPSITANVSQDRITQFFTSESDGYSINTNIREMVIFASQNIIKDPPFTKLDILSCRNLLIYMEPELQKKLIVLFHYSLNPGGIMLLGSAESDNSQNGMFTSIDARLKFYKRSVTPITTELINFPSSFSHKKIELADKVTQTVKVTENIENIQTLAEQLLLQRFAPACVLVNEQGDILFIIGRTGKYLELATGKANMNIYAMAREGLSNELPSAIRKARQNYEPLLLHNLKVISNGSIQVVDVTIQHIEKPEAIKGTFMMVFNDVNTINKLEPVELKTGKQDTYQHELELEIQRLKEDLQNTFEEMQSSQEELKSSNEELQSSNEELQSANEELTTSKEEMQSLNEEMQTVNIELQSKITDFVQAHNDMKNLLNSTDIATLFLDKELNVRRFTDQITKIFKLRPSDIGRLFTDIVSDLQYPEIANHAIEVLNTLVFKETNISTIDNRWFTVRIMPYRTLDDHIDGLVITFIDNTVAKKAEIALTVSETRYRELFESAKKGI